MKHHRFIRFLGEEVEAVGDDVAALIQEAGATEAISDIPDEWDTTQAIADRMQRDLPRRIADRIHGQTKGGVDFVARTVTETQHSNAESESGADFAIAFEVELPDYTLSKGVLITTVPMAARSTDTATAPQGLAGRAATMLQHSPAAYIFALPVDGSVAVVPAQAVVAAARAGTSIPATFPDEFYRKSLERFTQDLARCFLGDHSFVPSTNRGVAWSAKETQYREMMVDQGLDTLLYIGVQQGDRDARLTEF